jgi:hypothetical protein
MNMRGKKIPYVSPANTGITFDTQIPSLQKYNLSIRNTKFNLNKNFNRPSISILAQVVIFYLLISAVTRGNLLKKDHQSRSSSYFAEERIQVHVNKACFNRNTVNIKMSSVNSSNETFPKRVASDHSAENLSPGHQARTPALEHPEPNQFLPSHQGTTGEFFASLQSAGKDSSLPGDKEISRVEPNPMFPSQKGTTGEFFTSLQSAGKNSSLHGDKEIFRVEPTQILVCHQGKTGDVVAGLQSAGKASSPQGDKEIFRVEPNQLLLSQQGTTGDFFAGLQSTGKDPSRQGDTVFPRVEPNQTFPSHQGTTVEFFPGLKSAGQDLSLPGDKEFFRVEQHQTPLRHQGTTGKFFAGVQSAGNDSSRRGGAEPFRVEPNQTFPSHQGTIGEFFPGLKSAGQDPSLPGDKEIFRVEPNQTPWLHHGTTGEFFAGVQSAGKDPSPQDKGIFRVDPNQSVSRHQGTTGELFAGLTATGKDPSPPGDNEATPHPARMLPFPGFSNTVQENVAQQMEIMSLQPSSSDNAETSHVPERRHPSTRVTIASVTSRMDIPVPTLLRSPSDWAGASDAKSGSKTSTGSAKAVGQSKDGTPCFNPTPLNPREVQSRIGIVVPSSLAPPKPPAIGPTGLIQPLRVSSASNVSGVEPSPSPPVPPGFGMSAGIPLPPFGPSSSLTQPTHTSSVPTTPARQGPTTTQASVKTPKRISPSSPSSVNSFTNHIAYIQPGATIQVNQSIHNDARITSQPVQKPLRSIPNED